VSDEELFYLKTRGITDAESRKLVVFGFINDAIARIGDDPIEEMIRERLAEKFARI
jgi:Fe-S cluster assembly protein SufD